MKSNSVVCQFSEYFLDFRDSLIENLLLVCNAIIISRSTNLSVMKDYLPQLLENEQTVSCSAKIHMNWKNRFPVAVDVSIDSLNDLRCMP